MLHGTALNAVADPDLQVMGGGRGGGHPDPEIREKPGLKKDKQEDKY